MTEATPGVEADPPPRGRSKCLGIAILLALVPLAYLALRGFWVADGNAELAALQKSGLGIEDYEALVAFDPIAADTNAAELLLEAAQRFDVKGLSQQARDLLLGSGPVPLDRALDDPQDDPLVRAALGGRANLTAAVAEVASRVDLAQPLLLEALQRPICHFETQSAQTSPQALKPLLFALATAATLDFRAGRTEQGWSRVLLGLEVVARVEGATPRDYVAQTEWARFFAGVVVQLQSLGPPPSEDQSELIMRALERLQDPLRPARVLRVEFASHLAQIEGRAPGQPARGAKEGLKLLLWQRWRRDFARQAAAWLEFGSPEWGAHETLPPRVESALAQRYSKTLPNFHAKVLNRVAELRLAQATLRLARFSSAGLPADPWSPSRAPLSWKRSEEGELRVWSVGEDRQANDGSIEADFAEAGGYPGIHKEKHSYDLTAIVHPPR